jgi:hypothetical protein
MQPAGSVLRTPVVQCLGQSQIYTKCPDNVWVSHLFRTSMLMNVASKRHLQPSYNIKLLVDMAHTAIYIITNNCLWETAQYEFGFRGE